MPIPATILTLGWSLIHFLWQGASVALLYELLDRSARKKSIETRYVLSYVTLCVLVACLAITYSVEMNTAKAEALYTSLPPQAVERSIRGWYSPLSNSIGHRYGGIKLQRSLPWIVGGWCFGVFLLSTRTIVSYCMLRNMVRKADRVVPTNVRVALRNAQEQLGIAKTVLLAVSDRTLTPFVVGVFRVTIVLPVQVLTGFASEDLELIFAHELIHVLRYDYLTNLLQVAIETLLFFHPVVWWIGGHTRERREMCCDGRAAKLQGPVPYAKALLHLEESCSASIFAMPAEGVPGSLRSRIEYLLLGGEPTKRPYVTGMIAAPLCILFAYLLPGPKVVANIATQTTRYIVANTLHRPHPSPAIALTPAAPKPNIPKTPVAAALQQETPHSVIVAHSRSATISLEDDYVSQMRVAGLPYETEQDRKNIEALRALHISPDYVAAMGATGYGVPSFKDLVALKIMKVTPEYIEQIHAQGIAPDTLREVVGTKAYRIDKTFSDGMVSLGYGTLSGSRLLKLRQHEVTLAYAQWFHDRFPAAGVDSLQMAAVAGINDQLIARAVAEGVSARDLQALLAFKQGHAAVE